MYKIELLDLSGNRLGTLHYPHSANLLINPILSRGVNRAGSLTFDIAATHALYQYIHRMQCYIRVWRNVELIFECRPISVAEEGNIKSVTCEGSLAYLNDTIQWRKTYHDTTPEAYLNDKITWHNARVDDPMRQFSSVQCSVTNSTDNVYRIDDDLPTTMENIKKKLLDRLGGYIDVTYTVMRTQDISGNVISETITRGISYIPELPKLEGQAVRARVNLLTYARDADASDFYTVLIPTGATQEGNDYPIDISSVNDGHTYVENAAAVKTYGKIWATKSWQDVTQPANLKKYAQKDVDSITLPESITVCAADLSYINQDIVPLEYGCKIYVSDSIDYVDGWFACTDEEIHISDPSQNKYTLGGRPQTITKSERREVKYYD